MNTEKDYQKIIKNANAVIAWGFAAVPDQAKKVSDNFNVDESMHYDFEKVKEQFGQNAAFAWATCVQARESFFAEIEKSS